MAPRLGPSKQEAAGEMTLLRPVRYEGRAAIRGPAVSSVPRRLCQSQ